MKNSNPNRIRKKKTQRTPNPKAGNLSVDTRQDLCGGSLLVPSTAALTTATNVQNEEPEFPWKSYNAEVEGWLQDIDNDLDKFASEVQSPVWEKDPIARRYSRANFDHIGANIRCCHWGDLNSQSAIRHVYEQACDLEGLIYAREHMGTDESLLTAPLLVVAAHTAIASEERSPYVSTICISELLDLPETEVQWACNYLMKIGVLEIQPNDKESHRLTRAYFEDGFFELQRRWTQEQKIKTLIDAGFFPVLGATES